MKFPILRLKPRVETSDSSRLFRQRKPWPIVACVAVSLLAACGGGDADVKKGRSGPPPVYSPISGREVTSPDQRVLVIKVENTGAARPQVGLSAADMVFVEEVEGGITRLAAVFSSQRPDTVGPVRSARITDPQLVAQFGKVAFVYSGAQARMAPVLAAANLIQVKERRNDAWTRSTLRGAPHNLYGHPTALLDQAGDEVSVATSMSRSFGEGIPAGGQSVVSLKAAYPAESMIVKWDSAMKQWEITSGRDVITDGTQALANDPVAEGAPVRPADVLVQYVVQRPSQFHDRHGGVTPFAQTVGTGTGLFLRDGRMWNVKWSRPAESDPTVWTDAQTGAPVVFKRGTIWNLLIPKDRPVAVTKPAPSSASGSASPSTRQ